MNISCSIDIKSTPEVVFAWLARPEKARAWMTSVSETEIIHETPERVGTTFREVVSDGNGAMEMHGAITGFEPGRSIAFHLESKVNALDVTYCVEPTAGGARLSEDAEVRWKFPLNVYAALFGAKVEQGILAQLQNEFGQLKALCEAEAARPAAR